MNRLLENAGISFLCALGSAFIALIFWKATAGNLESLAGVLFIIAMGYAFGMLEYCLGFLLAYADDYRTEFKNFVKS